ncbi:hypothetical protein, partial [Pseudomonas corrugata]|uniref:hypothetical protein n=1 Tax=Pseudomonas corrugata TaxID=47879 RepID=UPI001F519137
MALFLGLLRSRAGASSLATVGVATDVEDERPVVLADLGYRLRNPSRNTPVSPHKYKNRRDVMRTPIYAP